jgi:general secretion pathway protein N
MKRFRLALAVVIGLALPSPPLGASELTNPLAVPSLDRLSETTGRPLFAPNRRRPAPVIVAAPEAAPPPPPPAPPRLSLYGIIQDQHGARAIVKPGAGDRTLGLRVGDHIESWSVTAIDRRKLTLSHEERSVVFSLFDDSGPSDQPKPVPPHRSARVIELNAAGVLTARRVGNNR